MLYYLYVELSRPIKETNERLFVMRFLDARHVQPLFSYNSEYSDIVVGPMPHKTTRMGDVNSFLAKLRASPSKYPRVMAGSANGSLKLSISSFQDCLSRTRCFESLA